MVQKKDVLRVEGPSGKGGTSIRRGLHLDGEVRWVRLVQGATAGHGNAACGKVRARQALSAGRGAQARPGFYWRWVTGQATARWKRPDQQCTYAPRKAVAARTLAWASKRRLDPGAKTWQRAWVACFRRRRPRKEGSFEMVVGGTQRRSDQSIKMLLENRGHHCPQAGADNPHCFPPRTCFFSPPWNTTRTQNAGYQGARHEGRSGPTGAERVGPATLVSFICGGAGQMNGPAALRTGGAKGSMITRSSAKFGERASSWSTSL